MPESTDLLTNYEGQSESLRCFHNFGIRSSSFQWTRAHLEFDLIILKIK